MLNVVDELIECLRGVMKELDPSSLSGQCAASLVDRFASLERLAASGKCLCARRVAETRFYETEGARDAGSWLASVTGDSKSAAEDTLATGKSLKLLPQLDAAVRSGELSPKQAHEVAGAACLDPDSTDALLRVARSESLGGLRAAAREVEAAARSKEEDEERHARVHAERHLRTWTERDGAFSGRFSLTPEAGALVMGPLERLADAIFEQAWKEGRREPHEAYLADALVHLATGVWPGDDAATRAEPCRLPGNGPSSIDRRGCPAAGDSRQSGLPDVEAGDAGSSHLAPAAEPSPPRLRRQYRPDYTIIMRIDLEALARGRLLPGEECSIDGVGHVPVSVVQSYLDRAKVRLVVTDGLDLKSIFSFKRNVSVALDTALHFRDRSCAVPGCTSTFHLERDHVKEYAKRGPTALENMVLLCSRHHTLKTAKGYRIEGSPGKWRWLRPDGTRAGP